MSDFACSHEGCDDELPDGDKIPAGWTVAQVEEYGKAKIATYYVYLCPDHKLTSAPRQTSLFPDAAMTPIDPVDLENHDEVP